MTTPKKQDREPIIPGEPSKQDIPDSLRQILEMNREISLGDYGEGPKSISVKHDKKTYKFYQDSWRDGSGWVIDITDGEGNYETTVDIVEKSDIEYLEKLFEQDIPDGLRHALEKSRDISYEDYGEKKVVSVKYGGKIYKFYRDHREYAEWAMDVSDEKGEWLENMDVREKSDVDYLEKLFEQDIPDGLRHTLEESREVSYEDYGDKKVVSAKYNGKTYKFYRANNEYADWAMEIEDEKGEWLGTTDVREKSDVDYLEKLFETPTKDEQIQSIKDRI